MAVPFMDKLVDWRDFEIFVRDLYAEDADVVVEHDVTEVGKSGARRQIDVKITQTRGLHTFSTIVECKRWKEPIDRQRIDVLASSIEDLNASKGVLFTTSGFEAGAEKYAAHKGIDLFIVRDLREDEWGSPGREIWMYLQIYTDGAIQIDVNAQLLTGPGIEPPNDYGFSFDFGKDAPADPALGLHSVRDGSSQGNLATVVLEARSRALTLLSRSVGRIDSSVDNAARYFLMDVTLDFSGSDYRQIPRSYGAILLNTLRLTLPVTASQSRLDVDRGASVDLAVAVENFVTNARHVVTRREANDGLVVRPYGDDESNATEEESELGPALTNGHVFGIIAEVWAGDGTPPEGAVVEPTKRISFALPSWQLTVEEPPTDQDLGG